VSDKLPPDPKLKTPAGHGVSHVFRARFVTISWHDLLVSIGPIALFIALLAWLAVVLVHPAPPDHIVITAGPRGSVFWDTGLRYQAILARNGIRVELRESDGAPDNLRRLLDKHEDVDVGFVQGGVSDGADVSHLMSLGSIAYVPLVVYYKEKPGHPMTSLAPLKGKRIAIGPQGSGTRMLAMTLLKANGIEAGDGTRFTDSGGEDAASALKAGQVDAVFLMGDSATPPTMMALAQTPGIDAMDFAQAQAYARRYPYLSALMLPMGALDFGHNVPAADMHLIAPMVELVARDTLHPALSDLLIDAARQVNGGASLLQHAGQFPAPLPHEYRISDDASRYYTSGKSFLYRTLPFWLASLADRLLVILLPVLVVLIPSVRLVPALYSWRIKARIYRWYGALIALERSMFDGQTDLAARQAMLARLDEIEASVNRLKMPLAFADQFYVLREHIGFVRGRLARRDQGDAGDAGEPGVGG